MIGFDSVRDKKSGPDSVGKTIVGTQPKPLTIERIDEALEAFKQAMREKLISSMGKGDWSEYTERGSIERIDGEYAEIGLSYVVNNREHAAKECIDLANVAMFFWDNAGRPRW
jgi:hypothetical protein